MTDDWRSPDVSTCYHCGGEISWDEVCYTHDASGFAECGVTVSGGRQEHFPGVTVMYDPDIDVDPRWKGSKAEPWQWHCHE